MYAYITQERPNRGLPRLRQLAQTIITHRTGLYAMPLLLPTQAATKTTEGNPVYIYQLATIALLPVPSDTDISFFTVASGIQQRSLTVGCASVRVTRRANGLHVEHHSGVIIFGACFHGELRTLANTTNTTPQPTTIP